MPDVSTGKLGDCTLGSPLAAGEVPRDFTPPTVAELCPGRIPENSEHVPTTVDTADAVFFVDHYVNYHDHELGNAFLKIMQHQGIRVAVPFGQVASGMAMISSGDLEAARELAEKNINILSWNMHAKGVRLSALNRLQLSA